MTTTASAIWWIECKDCGTPFAYDQASAERDARVGATRPERCPTHRPVHRREYRSLGVSHGEVRQLRDIGVGGLGVITRARAEPVRVEREPPSVDPLPVDGVIGSGEGDGLLLDKLLNGPERVFVVIGPTGSGKSTWLPYRLVRAPDLVATGPIWVTEPRIEATVGPATWVGHLATGIPMPLPGADPNDPTVEWPCGAGLPVGFRHGRCKIRHDAYNRLLYMTDRTLWNWMESGELSKCGVVMIDEAHERTLNIDVCLTGLRYMLDRYPRLRVIIASATISEDLFLEYFGGASWSIEADGDGAARGRPVEGRRGAAGCCVARSAGFTYPILQLWGDERWIPMPRTIFEEAFADPFAGYIPGWRRLDAALRNEWGPEPCLTWGSNKPGGALRYYPEFEMLVSEPRGVPAAAKSASPSNGWQRAVDLLRSNPSKPSRVVDGTVKGATLADAIAAVAEAMLELVLLDETFAAAARGRRWTRWEDGYGGGRKRPKPPAPRGNILGFLPTKAAVTECAETLDDRIAQLVEAGRLPPETNAVVRAWGGETTEVDIEMELAVRPPEPGDERRRVIVATPVAETSLTLPNLAYVVDSGLTLHAAWDADEETSVFKPEPHSQAGLRQRVGRVGRSEPGIAVRLYSRDDAARREPYTPAAIRRDRTEEVLLDAWSIGIDPSRPGVFLESPGEVELRRAHRRLEEGGGLARRPDGTSEVTRRGLELRDIAADFQFRPLLLEADRHACLWEMAWFLTLSEACGNTVDTRNRAPLFNPPLAQFTTDKRDKGATWLDDPWLHARGLAIHRRMREDCADDLEMLLRIAAGWMYAPDRRGWARGHVVSHEALADADMKVRGLLENAFDDKAKGYQPRPFDFAALDKVRFLVAAAFPDRRYERAGGTSFSAAERSEEGAKLTLHPDSSRHNRQEVSVRRGGQERAAAVILALNPKRRSILRDVVVLPPSIAETSVPVLGNLRYADIAIAFASAIERLDDPSGPFAAVSLEHTGRWHRPHWPFPPVEPEAVPVRDTAAEKQLDPVAVDELPLCQDSVAVLPLPEDSRDPPAGNDARAPSIRPLTAVHERILLDTHRAWPQLWVRPTSPSPESPAPLLPVRLLRPGNLQGAGRQTTKHLREAWSKPVPVVAARGANGLVSAHRVVHDGTLVETSVKHDNRSVDAGGFRVFVSSSSSLPYRVRWDRRRGAGGRDDWRLVDERGEGQRTSAAAARAVNWDAEGRVPSVEPPRVGARVQASVSRIEHESVIADVEGCGRGKLPRWCALAAYSDWERFQPGAVFEAFVLHVGPRGCLLSQIEPMRKRLPVNYSGLGAVVAATPQLILRVEHHEIEGKPVELALPPTYRHDFDTGQTLEFQVQDWHDRPRIRVRSRRYG